MDAGQYGKQEAPQSPLPKLKFSSSPNSPYISSRQTSLALFPRNLENARVVQRNLVYIINLPLSVSNEPTLLSPHYFGKYGKIIKIHINRTPHNIVDPTSGAYLTYSTEEEAAICIKACHDFVLDGKKLTVTYGTTKYCSYFLKNARCQKSDCLFLHSMGPDADTIFKEDMLNAKQIQPQNSIIDKIKISIDSPMPPSKLPEARLLRSRTISEQVETCFSSSTRKFSKDVNETSKFQFIIENNEKPVVVPNAIEKIRLMCSPCKEYAILPSENIEEIMSPTSPDKWVTDIISVTPISQGQNNVLVTQKNSVNK